MELNQTLGLLIIAFSPSKDFNFKCKCYGHFSSWVESQYNSCVHGDTHISGAPAARRAAKRSPILIWERKGNP